MQAEPSPRDCRRNVVFAGSGVVTGIALFWVLSERDDCRRKSSVEWILEMVDRCFSHIFCSQLCGSGDFLSDDI